MQNKSLNVQYLCHFANTYTCASTRGKTKRNTELNGGGGYLCNSIFNCDHQQNMNAMNGAGRPA